MYGLWVCPPRADQPTVTPKPFHPVISYELSVTGEAFCRDIFTDRFALPIIIAPALSSYVEVSVIQCAEGGRFHTSSTAGAFFLATAFFKEYVPTVVGIPKSAAVMILSCCRQHSVHCGRFAALPLTLTVTGIPCNGPRKDPFCRSISSSAARRRRSSRGATEIMALSWRPWWLCRWIWSR